MIEHGGAQHRYGAIRRHAGAILLLALASPLYLVWACTDQIGFLGSDGPAYLVMARHYMGTALPGSPTEIAAVFSRFPPLYALVLAMVHAPQHLLLGHAVSTILLLLGLLALYLWIHLESGWAYTAAALALAFAMLRPSWILALALQSEFLYLPLSIGALACLAAYRHQARAEWLYLAAVAIGGALLTRGVGMALLPPLLLMAWRAPLRTALFSLTIALMPYLLWHLLHHDSNSYGDAVGAYYQGGVWEQVKRQLATELPALWGALHDCLMIPPVCRPLVDLIGVLCLAATLYRARRLAADVVYLGAYLLILLVWPSDINEAQRYSWPVMAIFLAQPLLTLPRQQTIKWHRTAIITAYCAALLLLGLPGIIFAGERFHDAASSGIPGARGFTHWYDADTRHAQRRTAGEAMEIRMLEDLPGEVPPSDCILSIRPDLIHYFADRYSGMPPDDTVPEAQFEPRLHRQHCGYIFMTTEHFTGYAQPLHPLQKLDDQIDVVDYRELPPAEPGDGRIICMLAKFKRP